jgi:hypothetical protein
MLENEAATLKFSLEAITAKKDEYMKYMSDLNEQWAAVSNMVSSEQQSLLETLERAFL